MNNFIQKCLAPLNELLKLEINQTNPNFIKFHNSFTIKETWTKFLWVTLAYWTYSTMKLIIKLLIDYLSDSILFIDSSFIVFDQGIMLLPLFFDKLLIQKLNKRSKPKVICFIIFLYQLLIFLFTLLGVIFNWNASKENATLIVIALQLMIATQRLLIFKIITILQQSIFLYFALTHQETYAKIEIIFGICVILALHSFWWNSVLLRLSKFKKIQKDTFLNIPTPLFILNSKGTKVIFRNKQMKLLQMQKQNSLLDCRSRSFFQISSRQIPDSNLLKDESVKVQNDIFTFLQQHKVDIEDVSEQLQFDTNRVSVINNCIDLNQILKLILLCNAKIDDSTFKAHYLFRSILINEHEEGKQNNAFEVRVTTNITYDQSSAILITISDISKHLKSLYYKNMNIYKSRLIKSISHELRTRLNIIQGMIEMVLNSNSSLKPESRQLLKISFDNCRIQTHIVGSIINYNLIQENQIESKIEFCKLKSIVEEAYRLFLEETKLKNIKFTFKSTIANDEKLDIDRQLLMDILVNILSNSVKFTQRDGSITLTVDSVELDRLDDILGDQREASHYFSENQLSFKSKKRKRRNKFKLHSYKKQISNQQQHYYLIEIADTGIGIEKEKLARIQQIISFNEPADQQSHDNSEGSMLGVRILCSLMNYINKAKGKWVNIDSIEDEGTKVAVYLKSNVKFINESRALVEIIEEEEEIPEIRQMSFRGQYSQSLFEAKDEITCSSEKIVGCTCSEDILIVDDESYNLMVLEQLFKLCGQKTTKADNGLAAYNLVKKRVEKAALEQHNCKIFKFILMDYQMPIMNGEEATRSILELCEQRSIPGIPIIGCTGFSSKEDIQQLTQAGMIDVIIKPITKRTIEYLLYRPDIVDRSGKLKQVSEKRKEVNQVSIKEMPGSKRKKAKLN